MERDERAVRGANDAFYAAIATRNAEAMDALWSSTLKVACIHPGWAPLFGRDVVMESWARILRGPGAPKITVSDVHVALLGDSATVICRETITDADGGRTNLVATNVFARQEGSWRIVHHHVGPAPRATAESDAVLRSRRRALN